MGVAIPYGRQSIDADDIAAVVRVLEGDWLTQGPEVRAFEEEFAAAVGAPYAVAFSSGTAALHGAAAAAGVGPGDVLVTSAITFAASANCGAYLGARPAFADIDPATWNVSAESLLAAGAADAAAVVPVHFAGLPAPIAEIRAALGPGVRIIEDAAHAIGATAGGEPVGSCRDSDMAIFSFHPVKTITTGEGGMVTTRDPELRDRLTRFRTHGIVARPDAPGEGGWFQEQHELGFNYRLTDLQSALGRTQLRRLDAFVERRNAITARYRAALQDVEAIELPPEPPAGSRHGRHLFVIRLREGQAARRALYDHLRSRGILAQVHYVPVYRHPWYRETFGYAEGLCPEAERLYSGCLSLPCFPDLTSAEQDEVIAEVRAGVGG
jgi:UDP-4-amino-4,6-dideoxy-N-acetyl-beta-L-altrosamine transaminase